MANIRIIETQG